MKTELVSESPSEAGGYKEIVFAVKGDEPYRLAEARVGSAPRAARARDRGAGAHPYQHRYGRGAARGRRGRGGRDQTRRPADRHVQVVGSRRPVREQDRICHPHHARSQRHRRRVAARALAAAESREGDGHAPRHALRPQAARAGRGGGLDAPRAGGHRRARGEDPHLQLSARPHHRPPHQPQLRQHPRDHGRRPRRTIAEELVADERARRLAGEIEA